MKTISCDEARAIDRDAIERLGMPSILLMENASRGLAEVARPLGDRYVILCGGGNNGGDGLAAARHLGPEARIALLREPDPQRAPDAALQLEILRRAGWSIEVGVLPEAPADAVWIDALFGTGLTRAVEGRAAEWIAAMNARAGHGVAVDIPSGLHGDSGVPLGPCVRADFTATFECAKHGLVAPGAAAYVGRIEVVSLGLPAMPSR